jgi:tellurite resistance protein
MTATKTHDALVYLMVTMSAADTSMTDAELAQIGSIIRTLPVFKGFNQERLVEIASKCQEMLQEDDGLDEILDIVHNALPERLYDTAYALAVEVAAADLHVEQEELRFLQMLRDRLDLDKLTVAAIERSARARFRKME